MFNVKLVDIAGDGLVTDFDSTIETLVLLEKRVIALINVKLGVHSCRLDHVDDLVYSVIVDGIEVGVVVIKDVNPAPIKRK